MRKLFEFDRIIQNLTIDKIHYQITLNFVQLSNPILLYSILIRRC